MTSIKPIVAVVENDPAMLKAVERLLRAYGIATEIFSSAEMYLHREGEAAVGCLILDINLDGISGLELQKQLATKRIAPPIIFITGQTSKADHAAAIAMGCVAYLKKPFEAHALIKALDEVGIQLKPVS